jgi:hypothetical protein
MPLRIRTVRPAFTFSHDGLNNLSLGSQGGYRSASQLKEWRAFVSGSTAGIGFAVARQPAALDLSRTMSVFGTFRTSELH